MKSSLDRMFCACTGVALAIAGGPATTAELSASSADSELLVLQEVVVTARKREERLQDVPISITSVSAEQLQKQGITDVESFADTVPGLQFAEERDRSSARPGIRGVRTAPGEIAASRQKISTFFDGMSAAGPQSYSQFIDVDRVEVYRGPQSSQFGRAVFGGAINYISTPVNLSTYSGKYNATAGTERKASGSFLLTGPVVSDRLGFLLAANADNAGGSGQPVSSDGYRLGNTTTRYLSGKITYRPVNWMTATLRHQYTSGRDGASSSYTWDGRDPQLVLLPASIAPNVNANTSARTAVGTIKFGPLPAAAFNRLFCFPGNTLTRAAAPGQPNPTAATQVNDRNCIDNPYVSSLQKRTALNLDFDLPNGSVVQVSGFLSKFHNFRRDTNLLGRSNLMPYLNPVLRTFVNTVGLNELEGNQKETNAQAMLISSGSGRMRYTLGVSYYKYDSDARTLGNVTTSLVNTWNIDHTINRGLFGSLQYDLTDKITLSAEGRTQQENYQTVNPLANNASIEKVTKTFLPRFATTFKFSPTMSGYFQVAKGNNPAGANNDVVTPVKQQIAQAAGTQALADFNAFQTYEEETIWNYELGLKGSMLDRRFTYEVDIYKFKWTGYQSATNYQITPFPSTIAAVTAISGVGNNYNSRVFYNAGDINGTGLELSGNYVVNRRLAVTFAYAYSDTVYARGCDPATVQYGLPLSTSNPKLSACVDTKGKAAPYLSTHTLSGGVSFTTAVASDMVWDNRIDGSWFSKQFIDTSNIAWLPARLTANLRSTLSRGNLSGTLAVNNLTGNDIPTTLGTSTDFYLLMSNYNLSGNAGNVYAGTVPQRRSYTLSVNYRF